MVWVNISPQKIAKIVFWMIMLISVMATYYAGIRLALEDTRKEAEHG